MTPIRTQVREAVRRAWDRAIADGTLPPLPDDAARPAVEVEHPAEPGARRLREQPRDEARPAVPDGAARDRRGPPDGARRDRASDDPASTPIASAEVAPPGFLNLRLDRPRRSRRSSPAILREPAAWGRVEPRPRASSTSSSCRPTRPGPLHIGNARGAFVGDLLSRVLEAGGQQVTREYYFNDSGGQILNLGASVAALRRGEPVPEDGYKGDYVARARRRGARRRLGRGERPGTPTPPAIVGHWAAGRVREGIEASLTRARRPVRRLDERGSAPRGGLGRPRGRAAARARPRLRAGRRDLVPLDRVRRRQGPGHHPLQRRADLLRRRHRLRRPRSSAAASTTSSTSGAPTTTGRWPGSGTRPRPWATTRTRSR